MCIRVLLIYIQTEWLTLDIINKNYQWIFTFGPLKYMLSSKLLGLFSYTCMLQNFCFKFTFHISVSMLFLYLFIFHFKDWRMRWIIHIASSVMLHVWGRKSRSSVIKNRKSFHPVRVLSRQWRLINFRMHRSDDCRSWHFITNVNRWAHAKRLVHVCFTLKIINWNENHSDLISLFENLDKSIEIGNNEWHGTPFEEIETEPRNLRI